MIPLAAGRLRGYRADEIGILASPKLSNEDLFLLRRLCDALGVGAVDYRVPPAPPGDEDDFLIRADKNANTRGAELVRLGGGRPRAGPAAARGRRVKCLWIFCHDLPGSAVPE